MFDLQTLYISTQTDKHTYTQTIDVQWGIIALLALVRLTCPLFSFVHDYISSLIQACFQQGQ